MAKSRKKIECVNLRDTGDFYESLEDKVIHTAKNRGGGTVVVGFSDKTVTPNKSRTMEVSSILSDKAVIQIKSDGYIIEDIDTRILIKSDDKVIIVNNSFGLGGDYETNLFLWSKDCLKCKVSYYTAKEEVEGIVMGIISETIQINKHGI